MKAGDVVFPALSYVACFRRRNSMIPSQKTPVLVTDNPSETPQQRVELTFAHKIGNKPASCIANLQRLLDFYKITVRYNVISKRTEITIPDKSFTPENYEVATLAHIASYMGNSGLPTSHYREFLLAIGDSDLHNPVLAWMTSKVWDGENRIQQLCDTVVARREEAKNLFIRRWLVIAALLATSEGVDAPGCLVFQGKPNLGKTWWFRKLCPLPDLVRTDASVDPHDRDSVSQIISHWIVELGEIDSTFRRADIQALKAFITSPSDMLRRPYAASDQKFPRRTALAASVNESVYLNDPTGNRRFLTVECLKIDSYHTLDMQQVWAEVLHEIEKGATCRLTDRERELVDEINLEHLQIEPIEEQIISFYSWESALVFEWKTATQIAKDIGIKTPTQRDLRIVVSCVRKRNNYEENAEKRTSKGKFFLMPVPQ